MSETLKLSNSTLCYMKFVQDNQSQGFYHDKFQTILYHFVKNNYASQR